VQLPVFDKSREFIQPHVQGVTGSMCASAISTFCLCVLMCPIDCMATRYFSQPHDAQGRGVLYNNVLDASQKIIRVEGVSGLYKGFTALVARVGPQSFLSLVLFSYLMGK
jgi:solute carrier family 25 protein 34/35